MSVASRVVVCAALCASLATIATIVIGCPKADIARPLDRPAPPASGLADARVLFVEGNVEITPPEGAPFAAKVGTDLVADDRIGASPSSTVVVVLRNGHAVRIDDAGALKVRDIVLFQAPSTERPVDEQLKELLDEGESLPLAEVRDRAAAWRQMLRAAETGGAESRDDASREANSNAKKGAKLAASDEAPSAKAEVAMAPPPAAQPAAPPPESSDERGASQDAPTPPPKIPPKMRAEEAKMGKEDSGSPMLRLSEEQQRALTQPGVLGALGTAPAPLSSGFSARFGESAGEAQAIELTPALTAIAANLGTCIGRSLPASVPLSTADLLVEVREGKTKRVRLSGALPVPLCARNVAVERVATEIASTRGGSGWLVVTVPLSR